MNYCIDIQWVCDSPSPITDEQLKQWVTLALAPFRDTAELTLRFVNIDEITELNTVYRDMNKPTNVLAFPSTHPSDIQLDYPLLGDIIICPDILQQESYTLNKALDAHWALIVIHGVLHLLGFDHIEDEDANVMQEIENQLLKQLGFNNND